MYFSSRELGPACIDSSKISSPQIVWSGAAVLAADLISLWPIKKFCLYLGPDGLSAAAEHVVNLD